MRRTTARTAILAASVAALAVASGCYQHVVSAKGPGAERYDLHEPNIGPDDSVWATPRPRAKDDSYGLRSASEVPGQTRPASKDD